MTGNRNKISGNRFETEMCNILHENGWWSHNMAQNDAGQPADIIAVKDGRAVIIDCKLCDKDVFRLERVEPNQESAMTLWHDCGNRGAYFALRFKDGSVYMVPFVAIASLMKQGRSAITRTSATGYLTLEEWMRANE